MKKPSLKDRLQAAWCCVKGRQVLFNVEIYETLGLTKKDDICLINVQWNSKEMFRDKNSIQLINLVFDIPKHHDESNVINFKTKDLK